MTSPPAPNGNRVLGISPGDVIGGRYEVVRVLGVGGTGAVFEARHMTIGRTVAVKLLLPELATNPVIPQRFLQEARTANEVRHRNIVEVLDFGADNGRLYMVMEFLHGETLADFITREAPMAPGRILPLLDPILAALGTAHAHGIVHRDVKPQNIFLARVEGEEAPVPKLIDFGIAKRIASEDTHLTSTGMILGTPAYMAPEQASAQKNLDGTVDQYAVGVILYQCLTGRIPYQADTYPALLIQIVSQPPTDIRQHRPDLDPELADIVMRTLARAPGQRFASLTALREALRPWRDDLRPSQLEALSFRPPPAPATRPDGTPSGDDAPTVQRPRAVPVAPVAPVLTAAPVVTAAPRASQVPAPPPAYPTLPESPPVSATLPVLAAVVAVMALGMVSLAVWLAVRPAPVASRDAAAPRDQGVEAVTFRIDVTPPTAEIALDGTVVGHGHAEVLRPRDGRRIQLRLSAPGYAAASEVLVASSDVRVARSLFALGDAPRPPTPTPTPRPAPGHGPGGVAPAPLPPQVFPTPPLPRHDPSHPRIDTTNPF